MKNMYPLDRRKLAIHVYSLFNSLRKTALIIQVSHSTVGRWIKNPERVKYKRCQVTKSNLIVDTIRSAFKSNPFISVRALCTIIKDVNFIDVSRELVRTAIFKMGWSNKKARFFSSPKNLDSKTNEFLRMRSVYESEGRCFYSLDETSFGRHGKEARGYAPKGQLLRVQRDTPRRTTVSSMVLASNTGIIKHKEIIGSFNKIYFSQFLQELDLPEGSVILLDNVAFHHSKEAAEIAREKGFKFLFVPPYSPWFNPIEGIFSVIKRHFYKYGNILNAFKTITKAHCCAFFKQSFKTT